MTKIYIHFTESRLLFAQPAGRRDKGPGENIPQRIFRPPDDPTLLLSDSEDQNIIIPITADIYTFLLSILTMSSSFSNINQGSTRAPPGKWFAFQEICLLLWIVQINFYVRRFSNICLF